MEDVLFRALTFVLIIVIGNILKSFGIVKKEDGYILGRIIMSVTLPCALIVNATSLVFNSLSIVLILFGLFCSLTSIYVAYRVSKGKDKVTKATYMINASGYNIGNFSMPFIHAFFQSSIIGFACMFDLGAAIMSLGGTYSLAAKVVDSNDKLTVSKFLKNLTKSMPLMVYFILIFCSLFDLVIPNPIMEVASVIGGANSVLVMLMIGMLLDFNIKKSELRDCLNILIIRFSSAFFAILFIVALPIDVQVKQVLSICILAPATSTSPIFSKQLGYNGDVPAMVGSITIVLAIVVYIPLLIYFGM